MTFFVEMSKWMSLIHYNALTKKKKTTQKTTELVQSYFVLLIFSSLTSSCTLLRILRSKCVCALAFISCNFHRYTINIFLVVFCFRSMLHIIMLVLFIEIHFYVMVFVFIVKHITLPTFFRLSCLCSGDCGSDGRRRRKNQRFIIS